MVRKSRSTELYTRAVFYLFIYLIPFIHADNGLVVREVVRNETTTLDSVELRRRLLLNCGVV